MEAGTRVRLLELSRGMDGETPIGTLGTVIEGSHVDEYRWIEDEFAVQWDNATELNPNDPEFYYYRPSEEGERWELAND